jgi:hypothetical protein
MAYYVCPTCGAPLTLADPPSLSSRDRPRYDTPQLATCPSCGRLERGPLSEKRMKQPPLAYLLAIAIMLGVYWALWVVFTQLGDKDPVVTAVMTLGGAAFTITLVAWALIAILLAARKTRQLMAQWQPYRREGDAPVRQDAHRSSRASGGQSEREGEMFKRRNWLDWLVIGIIVIAVVGVGVYAYQSYRESREKKEAQAVAQAAFETYGNAVIHVRNSYIRAYNKVWGDPGEENYGLLNRVDPWASKLQRAVRALAAIESPDQFADAHAALVGAWRKEVPFIRDHGRIAIRVFDNEPYMYAFDAHSAWLKRVQKEIDITLKADKRVEAAWEKWLAAANQEAKRLGVTVSGD